MNYKEYQELASKTFAESGDETLNLMHCAIGASTEAGELLDAFKKHVYYKKELDVVNVGEEIADIQWYLFNLCRLLNLDMEQLLEANIAKLKARYGDKFSEEKAINRDLNTERVILETGVVFENRELDNGGMKPPKNNWVSYAETVAINDYEKQIIKNEAKELFLNESYIEPGVENVFSITDIASAFSYLEEYDGDLAVKLASEMKDVDVISEIAMCEISESQKQKIKNGELVCLLVKVLSDDVEESVILLLEFNMMEGVLKFHKTLSRYEEIYGETQQEIEKFFSEYGIQK